MEIVTKLYHFRRDGLSGRDVSHRRAAGQGIKYNNKEKERGDAAIKVVQQNLEGSRAPRRVEKALKKGHFGGGNQKGGVVERRPGQVSEAV